MKLEPREIPAWPKLAWLARLVEGSDQVTIFHGPMAEVGSDWLAAAVWAGEFSAGDFDQTDLIFGSGVRLRGDKVVFVSSGAGQERLWHASLAGMTHVSNSLPAILASAGLSCATTIPVIATTFSPSKPKDGSHTRRRSPRILRTCISSISAIWYLTAEPCEKRKSPTALSGFAGFGDYFAFLTSSARCVGQNLSAAERRHKVVPLATISSGYDSGAAAVIAGYAGCKAAVTIRNSSMSLARDRLRRAIARHLACFARGYDHAVHAYRNEAAVWAAAGKSGGLNITIFDFPEPLCLFFSGIFGDFIWDPKTSVPMIVDMDAPAGRVSLVRRAYSSASSLGGEFGEHARSTRLERRRK